MKMQEESKRNERLRKKLEEMEEKSVCDKRKMIELEGRMKWFECSSSDESIAADRERQGRGRNASDFVVLL